MQQLFPAGIPTRCCAVPSRGADQGRKGTVFALRPGEKAVQEQRLFSQSVIDLAMLILAPGTAWAL